ncbi:unnamed protein product [Triticum turgidum subsp. durum]|uniref:F-box domain-containing protein n=1 Tax=Triticum turgidum subsp. durum TaxID=4567 RepID=A0A9R0SQD9_TRITD|nr:unnamed protein product [Triticum turgidum subsp. durum]
MVPDYVLAGVLRLLAPRGLAASRCVCKAWRRVIDDRRLLRSDLLPRSLGGIFLNYLDLWFTQLLSRPTTGTAISGRLDYTVPGEPDLMPPIHVRDHCNGLLLLHHCVVNPATQQWAPLPPAPDLPQPPPPGMISFAREHLVFDPTLSPNYFEVLIVPDVPSKNNDDCEDEAEWPPSTLILQYHCQTGFHLQVWFLNDPCLHGQTEWVLKHDRDIFSILPNLNYDKQRDGPWILQEFRYWANKDAADDSPIVYNSEATVEQKFVWDCDNDNVLKPGGRINDCCIIFLGFHPYKEVVFLSDKFDRVLAYNWSSSKLQDLGKVFSKFYTDPESDFYHRYVQESFPYTPCWLGELPEKVNLEAH